MAAKERGAQLPDSRFFLDLSRSETCPLFGLRNRQEFANIGEERKRSSRKLGNKPAKVGNREPTVFGLFFRVWAG